MNGDTKKAKDILQRNEYTCVLYCNGKQCCSRLRGVKPLMDFLEAGDDFNGFSAADKTVGAGAAHLYVLLGVKEVWANVISENGKNILEQTVPYIINRKGDGVCPIENAVKNITCSEQALVTIKQTLQKLAD